MTSRSPAPLQALPPSFMAQDESGTRRIGLGPAPAEPASPNRGERCRSAVRGRGEPACRRREVGIRFVQPKGHRMNIEASCTPHPDEPNVYLLFLELAAAEEASQQRKPIHLVLAIDASSSMGGPRLACAVEAGRAVADRLGPEDMFCLLAFDRSVRTLFGPGLADEPARKAIHEALVKLKPGVGTALYDALEKPRGAAAGLRARHPAARGHPHRRLPVRRAQQPPGLLRAVAQGGRGGHRHLGGGRGPGLRRGGGGGHRRRRAAGATASWTRSRTSRGAVAAPGRPVRHRHRERDRAHRAGQRGARGDAPAPLPDQGRPGRLRGGDRAHRARQPAPAALLAQGPDHAGAGGGDHRPVHARARRRAAGLQPHPLGAGEPGEPAREGGGGASCTG
jgi:hypothetical protein